MSCLHFIWKCLPFNWEIPIEVWSSIVTAAIGFLGVYMAAHPPNQREKGGKWFYKISFLVLAAMIIVMTWRQNHNGEKEKKQMFLSNSNQLSRLQRGLDDDKVQITAQRLEIQELTTALSTNQSMDSATRLAVLDKKDQEVITGMKALIDRIFSNEKIFAGENETTNKHELITEDVTKLKILREERETRQALLKTKFSFQTRHRLMWYHREACG
jgi:hypothetical protein